MVGDALEVDIAAGKSLEMGTILVLSGTSGRQDIGADLRPDRVISTVAELVAG